MLDQMKYVGGLVKQTVNDPNKNQSEKVKKTGNCVD